MAARVTRAKKKIAAARIPTGCRPPSELPDRLRRGAHRGAPALHHRAHRPGRRPTGAGRPGGAGGRPGPDAARRSCPTSARYAGCSRCCCSPTPGGRPASAPTAGCCCSRSRTAPRWDRAAIAEGARAGPRARCAAAGRAGSRCRRRSPPLHAEAPDLRRHRLARRSSACTTCCCDVWPSPVVGAQPGGGGVHGGRPGGRAGDASRRWTADGRLAGYHYLPATRADLLRRLGRRTEAAAAYRQALELTDNAAERGFLRRRLDEVSR